MKYFLGIDGGVHSQKTLGRGTCNGIFFRWAVPCGRICATSFSEYRRRKQRDSKAPHVFARAGSSISGYADEIIKTKEESYQRS